MPRDRSAGSDCGFVERSRSRRAIASGPLVPVVAQATTATTSAAEPRVRMVSLLPIGVEHVLEAHPVRIEVQVDVAHAAVTILAHKKLGGALDVPRVVIHPFAIQRENDISVMLHCAERAEIIELRPAVRASRQQWKLRCRQYGDTSVERQRLQGTDGYRLV